MHSSQSASNNRADRSKDEANAWLAARWDEHMAASHPKVGKALFEMGVTSSCEFEKHQYFTTHLHIAPEDELIYLGGLPPVSTPLRTTVCASRLH